MDWGKSPKEATVARLRSHWQFKAKLIGLHDTKGYRMQISRPYTFQILLENQYTADLRIGTDRASSRIGYFIKKTD